MKNKYLLTITGILFLLLQVKGQNKNQDKAAAGQHAALGMSDTNDNKGRSNPHPGAQWFPEAGLGLFIHWGLASVHGGIDLSWGMLSNKSWKSDGTITPNEYYGLIKNWKADGFNMDKTLKAASQAGFKYAVLVTKHHDGFTLWPSAYGEIGTKTTFNGRDFVKEFVDACRKYKLRVGLYYSPPDWYFDREYRNWRYSNSVWEDMNHNRTVKKEKNAGHDEARKLLVQNHVKELLTRYGKIDLLWFDAGKGEMPNDTIRKMVPGIVINRRNGGGGDYNDSEGKLPETPFSGWFEANEPCWPTSRWSYSTSDVYDNASTVLSNLVKMRAWGGNYLANVGPYGSGEVQPEAYACWKEMAGWMKHSSESVFGVKKGSYPDKASVPVTVKENVAYCFALPAYQGYVTLQGVKAPKKVSLLRTGEPLKYQYADSVMNLQIPPKLRTMLPDAVKVEW